MSFEVIETIKQVEIRNQERRAAADAEARETVSKAEREGLALLQQTRSAAAESGKKMLRQAEDRAAKRTEEIRRAAEQEAAGLRKSAERHLEEAAEFIVGRVVKH